MRTKLSFLAKVSENIYQIKVTSTIFLSVTACFLSRALLGSWLACSTGKSDVLTPDSSFLCGEGGSREWGRAGALPVSGSNLKSVGDS